MKTIACDLLIRNASQLVTVSSPRSGPRRGREMEELGIIRDGALAARSGAIVAAGRTDDILETVMLAEGGIDIDAGGKVVTPGLVDAHTHPVFAGSREDEFEQRLKGTTYQEIAAAGGGIRSTVRKVRQASREELFRSALPRLDRMMEHGTTTIEAKSGYGLSCEAEIKLLGVIRELNEQHPMDIVPTFLGAHEVPDEYRGRSEAYIDLVVEEMMPAVARAGLADFCDVFCEEGVFDVDQSRRILTAARQAGMKLKLHADELSPGGGAELAAELSAVSADHLVAVSPAGIGAMAEKGVIAVLLPGTTFSLLLRAYAPARDMIDAGLPVALATDMNPGSCRTESMPMIITLACVMMRLTPAEAVTAATINAAWAIGRETSVGSLDIGKKADVVIWDMPTVSYLPYHFGVNLAETVIKNGEVVVDKKSGH